MSQKYIEREEVKKNLFVLNDRNDKGQEYKRYFVYDLEKMTIKQKVDARRFFIDNEESKTLFPETTDQMKKLNLMQLEHTGYSLLLTEIDEDGKRLHPYVTCDGYTGMDFIERSTSMEDFARLETCKLDFFTTLGIQSKESMKGLANYINELTANGINQEGIGSILKVIMEAQDEDTSNAMKTLSESFTNLEAKKEG